MAGEIKSLNMRFPKEKWEKLKAKKDASGAKSWEAWLEQVAGIEE